MRRGRLRIKARGISSIRFQNAGFRVLRIIIVC